MIALDDRDRAIIRALSRDAWLTFVQLGDVARLSPSATQRRVERLRAAGVIAGARAVVAPEAMERPLRLYVLVELVNDARATLAAFSERVGGWEDVEEVQYVAGAADIVLVLQTTAMARFSHFAEAHLNDNPHVRRYQTLTVLRSLL